MEAETSQTQSTDTIYRVLAWLHANRKRLLIGIGVVAGLGLIAGFSAWRKDQNTAEANARLFELPVASSPNMPVIPPPPSAYLDLASKYPDTSAGEYAALFGAESLFVNGNYAESQHEFSKYSEDHPESPLVAEATMGVAACLEAEGKASEAIQKYQQVTAKYPSDLNVTGPAKLTMARLYEQQNRDSGAEFLLGIGSLPVTPCETLWVCRGTRAAMSFCCQIFRKTAELNAAFLPPLRPPLSVFCISPLADPGPRCLTPPPTTAFDGQRSQPVSRSKNLLNFLPAAVQFRPAPTVTLRGESQRSSERAMWGLSQERVLPKPGTMSFVLIGTPKRSSCSKAEGCPFTNRAWKRW